MMPRTSQPPTLLRLPGSCETLLDEPLGVLTQLFTWAHIQLWGSLTQSGGSGSTGMLYHM